jgi:DNA-binding transcriptional ArsR family regulator
MVMPAKIGAPIAHVRRVASVVPEALMLAISGVDPQIESMSNAPQMAEVAALVGDPSRANILCALLGGRALTATELAFAAGVSPQTTSGHLSKLYAARLLVLVKQGRHRYYRLAGPHVGQMLESIMNVALTGPPRFQSKSKLDDQLRRARTCYDHIAGRLGVGLADRLAEREFVILGAEAGEVNAGRCRLSPQARRRPIRRAGAAPRLLPPVRGLDRAPTPYWRRRPSAALL